MPYFCHKRNIKSQGKRLPEGVRRAGRDKGLARKEKQNLLGSAHSTNTYAIFSICLHCSRN